MRFLFALAATLPAASFGQDLSRPSHELQLLFGEGIKVFGSSDIREGGGITYSSARLEPHFSWRTVRAQFVYEGYVDYTTSVQEHPRQPSYAGGGLAYARWWLGPFRNGPQIYADLGWGLQVATRPTRDLPSDVNSTPMLDLGVAIPTGRVQTLLGVRWLHISNAGFVKPNRGQNQIFVTAGVRF